MHPKNKLLGFLATAVLTLLSGCPESNDDFCNSNCDPGEDVFFCGAQSNNNRICAPGPAAATAICGTLGVVAQYKCDNFPQGTGADDSTQYPNWDPDDLIRYDRTISKYVVDKDLVDQLTADGSVLWVMDDARMAKQPGGYFKLVSVGTDDMAFHLGFRTGDIVKSVNGTDLQTAGDYGLAFASYISTTYLNVVVTRGGSNLTLKYKVDD